MLQRLLVPLPWLIYGVVQISMAGFYLIAAWPNVTALPLIALALVISLIGYEIERFAQRHAFKSFGVILAAIGALFMFIAVFLTAVHLESPVG